MGRIADEELERLKKEVPLEALVAASGVELRRAGADLVGCCPFHDDAEPSLVVSPGKNLWHCPSEARRGLRLGFGFAGLWGLAAICVGIGFFVSHVI